MKEKPIVFSAEAVKAILADRKTQVRRVPARSSRPRYKPGDVLWVREPYTIYPIELNPEPCDYWYKADAIAPRIECVGIYAWRKAIHMPKLAARLWLEVTDVRSQRLQDVSDADALAEGAASRAAFIRMWNKANASRGLGWNVNPRVDVYVFKVIKPT